MDPVGRHLMSDWWGCGPRADDEQRVRRAMLDAVRAMGATLVDLKVHRFSPQGLTAVAILAESHLALHSWPEKDYVAIDAFTCGQAVRPEAALQTLHRYLQPTSVSTRVIPRGRPPRITAQHGAGPAECSHAT